MSPSRSNNDELAGAKRPKSSRRSHRKSRNGCLHCKRRKVKCDEARPACNNCVRFSIGCEYPKPKDAPSDIIIEELSLNAVLPTENPITTPIPRRGRGRPRKDWTVPAATSNESATSPSSATTTVTASSLGLSSLEDTFSLGVADTELLLHFISTTSRSLIGCHRTEDSMWKFWAFEVPRIGLSNHFVLHLVLAIASHQLARFQVGPGTDDCRSHYFTLAQNHFQEGLAGFRLTLPNLNESNGIALYISAILVCWCSFSAGPTGSNDLLVCDVGDEGATCSIPLVHGVRIIRTAMESSNASSSMMPSGTDRENAATYSNHFPTIEWEKPLHDLHDHIATSDSPNFEIYLFALYDMQGIFEEVCGKSDGSRSGSSYNCFVFGWLYRMEDSFVSCVRATEPPALLLLAYYAVLLGTMSECWFIEGWPQHLISRVEELVGPEDEVFIQWPREQVMNLVLNNDKYNT
ncbi:hypothetical protein F4677DRAFT_458091 [Hypoxylon crocopeplum]|nr:hypothetical protein F4677DRAFT_458091 [Hypoxylon crocopeplum]